jgi:inner membrane protein YidH
MNASEESGKKASMSDYLAAERTLLAWIRTGLALMGFGFVVARFGIFLEQIQMVQNHHPEGSYGLSLWFGTALIGSGVMVSISAGMHHLQLVRELDRNGAAQPHRSKLAVWVALFLALIGIGMTIYLISVRS